MYIRSLRRLEFVGTSLDLVDGNYRVETYIHLLIRPIIMNSCEKCNYRSGASWVPCFWGAKGSIFLTNSIGKNIFRTRTFQLISSDNFFGKKIFRTRTLQLLL